MTKNLSEAFGLQGLARARPFQQSYSAPAISRDAKQIAAWLKRGKEVFRFFNNDVGGAAPKDARRLEAVVA